MGIFNWFAQDRNQIVNEIMNYNSIILGGCGDADTRRHAEKITRTLDDLSVDELKSLREEIKLLSMGGSRN